MPEGFDFQHELPFMVDDRTCGGYRRATIAEVLIDTATHNVD